MKPLRYKALERIQAPRPRDRIEQIVQRAQGKLVFDLGALDETAFEAKVDHGRWLHARLCAVATRVVGIDNSALVPPDGMTTRPNGLIVNANIFELSETITKYGKPDLIVAGELIEHLPDTHEFLNSLRKCSDLQGVEFVFSTPNACSWHNVLIGLAGCESTHQDHLQIYSYKTLRTLFQRSGIDLRSLTPYGARFDEMLDQRRGVEKAGVQCFQTVVNLLERFTPMLSGGWVGVARI